MDTLIAIGAPMTTSIPGNTSNNHIRYATKQAAVRNSLIEVGDYHASTVLGCEQKSVEVEFRWLKLRVCNANYAAEQAIDAKFW